MADKIVLWTFQKRGFYEKLRRDGVIYADGRRVWRIFRKPYRWLMAQMKKRVKNYQGGYPIWAWHYPPFDLRRSLFRAEADGRDVALKLCVSADRALLSEFGVWHCVLNNYPAHLTEQEDDAFDRKQKKLIKRKLIKETQIHLQKENASTWPRIFDIELLKKHDYICGPNPEIQAVIEYVRLEDVVETRWLRKK